MPLRRIPLALLLLLLIGALVAGCGGDDDSGSEGSLGDSLAYLPKDAPFVVTLDSDVDGEQYRNLDRMLSKFPFGGQLKTQIKQSIARQGANYEQDVKPLLGGELVLGATQVSDLRQGEQGRFVFTYTAQSDKLGEVVAKDREYREAGDFEGGKLYQASDNSAVVVVKDRTMVGARTRDDLQAAFDRHDGDDHLTEEEFNASFTDLPADPLMRIHGDAQAFLSASPEAATARRVKWVGGLRKFGFTVNAEGDGLAVDGRVNTEGLAPEDLPVAAGDTSPALARFADYSVGQRDFAQTLRFAQAAAQATDPEGFREFEADKNKANRELGIDFDRDVIDQFSGDTTVAGGLDGSWALRSQVKDPAAMKETLDKMVDGGGIGDVKMKKASGGLIEATDEEGDSAYIGMVDDVFVAGPRPDAARELAGVEPRPVPGARGAMVFVADGEAIAKTAIERSGQNQAAGLFTGPLGDLTMFVTAAPDHMRARAKLKVE